MPGGTEVDEMTKSEALGPAGSLVWGSGAQGCKQAGKASGTCG